MADEDHREDGAPATSEPPTEAPSARAQSTEAPSARAQSTEAHQAEAQHAEAHSAKAHSIEAHSAKAHSIEAHSTKAHSIEAHSAEAPSAAPSEAPTEAAPPTPVSAEAAAPPAEPTEQVKEGAKEPEPGAPQPSRQSHSAPAPPAEPSAQKESVAKPEEVQEAPEEKKKDSMIRTSSVSFNKVEDGPLQRSSLMGADARKSGPMSRQSRISKDPYRRPTRMKKESMTSIPRDSLAGVAIAQKLQKYANTYKLYAEKPFNPDKVQSIITKILTETIQDTMTYDAEHCPNNAKLISSLIRTKVKEQEYDRYKLICVVTIGEKKCQDVYTGVRFLWDAERDKYATHMHENMHIFATATVFANMYMEVGSRNTYKCEK